MSFALLGSDSLFSCSGAHHRWFSHIVSSVYLLAIFPRQGQLILGIRWYQHPVVEQTLERASTLQYDTVADLLIASLKI